MKNKEKFKHFFWGENNIFFPNEQFVIKLSYPRLFVRYNVAESMFAGYNEWIEEIKEMEWLDGEEPETDEEIDDILTDIWNYIGIEERILEGDLKEEDFDNI